MIPVNIPGSLISVLLAALLVAGCGSNKSRLLEASQSLKLEIVGSVPGEVASQVSVLARDTHGNILARSQPDEAGVYRLSIGLKSGREAIVLETRTRDSKYSRSGGKNTEDVPRYRSVYYPFSGTENPKPEEKTNLHLNEITNLVADTVLTEGEPPPESPDQFAAVANYIVDSRLGGGFSYAGFAHYEKRDTDNGNLTPVLPEIILEDLRARAHRLGLTSKNYLAAPPPSEACPDGRQLTALPLAERAAFRGSLALELTRAGLSPEEFSNQLKQSTRYPSDWEDLSREHQKGLEFQTKNQLKQMDETARSVSLRGLARTLEKLARAESCRRGRADWPAEDTAALLEFTLESFGSDWQETARDHANSLNNDFRLDFTATQLAAEVDSSDQDPLTATDYGFWHGRAKTTLTTALNDFLAVENNLNVDSTRAPEIDILSALGSAKNSLEIGFAPGEDTDQVMSSLTLPQPDSPLIEIEWSSSAPDIISASGLVTRPASALAGVPVVLTANLSREGLSLSREFALTVAPVKIRLSQSSHGPSQISNSKNIFLTFEFADSGDGLGPGQLTESNFRLYRGGDETSGTQLNNAYLGYGLEITFDAGTGRVRLTDPGPSFFGAQYWLYVDGLTTTNGHTLTQPFQTQFTFLPPDFYVVGGYPHRGTTANYGQIHIYFQAEDLDGAYLTTDYFELYEGGPAGEGTPYAFSLNYDTNNNRADILPDVAFQSGQTYHFYVNAGAKSDSGRDLYEPFHSWFTRQ